MMRDGDVAQQLDGLRGAITLCEIPKASINLLAAGNVFQNVSHPASGANRNRVPRIELSIVEVEL
jgi:hypothetical protein